MTITGIPLHPLVVHAAVVLAPLAGLLAIVYAVVPAWRRPLRHLTLLLALGAAASVQVAAMTGDDLAHSLGGGNPLVEQHEEWAGRLQASAWILAVLALKAWWVLPVSGGRGRRGPAFLAPLVQVLLPLAGLAVLVLAVLTGHSGAEAVWKGVGQ